MKADNPLAGLTDDECTELARMMWVKPAAVRRWRSGARPTKGWEAEIAEKLNDISSQRWQHPGKLAAALRAAR